MNKYLILFLIVLVGCGQGSSSGGFDPNKGDDGLILSFLDVEDVYESSPIQFGIEIRNIGATDIERGVGILSLERNLFAISSEQIDFTLEGKKIGFPQGGRDIFFFKTESKKISVSEKQPTRAKFTVCYPYKTTLITQACIDPDVRGLQDDKPRICPGKTRNFRGGQGGPIVVQSMVTTMIPTENGVIPQFVFEVENVIDGFAFDVYQIDIACSSIGLTRNEIGRVDATNVKLGNELLVCTNTQLKIETRQKGDDFYEVDIAKIRCRGSEITSDKAAYAGTVIMELEYGYKQSVEEEFFVVKP